MEGLHLRLMGGARATSRPLPTPRPLAARTSPAARKTRGL